MVLDLFRRVILDPAEKHEVDLNKHHILKCSGPMSLCLEFQHVIEIRNIRGVSVRSLNVNSRNRRKEEAETLANLTPDERKKEMKRRKNKAQKQRKRKKKADERKNIDNMTDGNGVAEGYGDGEGDDNVNDDDNKNEDDDENGDGASVAQLVRV